MDKKTEEIIKIIGICGYAGSGKDYFAEKLQSEMNNRSIKCARIAFADRLKKDLNPFLIKKTGLSSFTKDQIEKRMIRPMLVGYGELQRAIDQDYWIKKVENTIDTSNEIGVTCVVTDVRYQNEASWVKSKGGYLVHVNRDGIPPPNQSEQKNLPMVKSMADFKIDWPTTDNEMVLEGIVIGFVKELRKKHESRILGKSV